NASRFVLMQCEEEKADPHTITKLPEASQLSLADRAMLSRLQTIMEKVTKDLEEYRLSEAGETMYSFVWDDFCDWYLELSKGNANIAVLVHILRKILVMLHPYCPFVTEELWSHVKKAAAGMLISQEWPTVKNELKDPGSEQQFLMLISTIQAIRKLRVDQNVEPGKKVRVTIVSKKHAELLETQREHIERMGKVEKLEITSKAGKQKNVTSEFLKDAEVYLSLEGLIDVEKEVKNLEKERGELQKFLGGIEAKLGNKQFVSNAPENVIAMEKEKLETTKDKLKKIEERLKSLQ
ncbi:class I tRNA ligase family protein, partial [Candidatus Peregrinibacteria bacterium]|nr:class I tRNA ligase family protein [Candidatus Peregrinibacteria bacterium]